MRKKSNSPYLRVKLRRTRGPSRIRNIGPYKVLVLVAGHWRKVGVWNDENVALEVLEFCAERIRS